MTLDVVGIGALNVDYIISKRTLATADARAKKAVREFEERIEEGAEVVVHNPTEFDNYLHDIGRKASVSGYVCYVVNAR